MFTVKLLWDEAPHNAFTDLLFHRGHFWCAFREGSGHVSDDGRIRVLTSEDGNAWENHSCLNIDNMDLRDAKLASHPDGGLMLSAMAVQRDVEPHLKQTYVWRLHGDGPWSNKAPIGEPDYWLWGTSWHQKHCYSLAYNYISKGVCHVRLYRSGASLNFEPWVPELGISGYANESAIRFTDDHKALCLLRRDPDNGLLGTAEPPYTQWSWQDLGMRIGGPAMIQLPDGRWIVAARRHEEKQYFTSLFQLELSSAKLKTIVDLPSGGDTSYPGLVWLKGTLWVSYYSSHEGQSNIYLASGQP